MTTLYIDIETYSRVDLKKSNVYRYVEDEHFRILFATWAIDDDPVQVAFSTEEIHSIPGLWDDSVEKVAHNAQFERICFSAFAGLPVGEYLDPEPWTDTAALAAEWGYPRKLEELAPAVGAEPKDTAGTRLINIFCKPNRKGTRTLPEDKPEDWQAFINYGIQDTVTLRDVRHRLPDWPTESERIGWIVDEHVNDTGIPVDTEMAAAAVEAAADNGMVQELEIMKLTGISNPNSNPQMLGWFRESGLDITNMQAATVTGLLARDDLTGRQRRVLELRQELALVAAKKYTAALDRVNADGRLRGSFQYFGAHTGRWAGRGVQLQNLPSATMGDKGDSPEAVTAATDLAILDLKLGNGADAHTLKALVRAMFVGPFSVVDYSAIEARVVAWLAGEQWALDAFADGRDIYVETAERMGPQYGRKDGKVAVLALGYNGGINALRVMGAEGHDRALQFLVNQWRDANPNTVHMWAEMDEAYRVGDRSVGDHLYIMKDGADRYIKLPSGRYIAYHDLKARWKDTPFGRRKVVSFADPKKRGLRTDTYGGRLTENVTQAVARDILAEAIIRLHDAGHEVVGHVHDEILVRDADGFSPVDVVTKLMVEQPVWAAGLPLAAEGYSTPRYRKD